MTSHSKLNEPYDDNKGPIELAIDLLYDINERTLSPNELLLIKTVNRNLNEELLKKLITDHYIEEKKRQIASSKAMDRKSFNPNRKMTRKILRFQLKIYIYLHNKNKQGVLDSNRQLQELQLESLDELEKGNFSLSTNQVNESIEDTEVYFGEAGKDENVRQYGEYMRQEQHIFNNLTALLF